MMERLKASLGVGAVVACIVSLAALMVELHPWLFAAAFVIGGVWCWIEWSREWK